MTGGSGTIRQTETPQQVTYGIRSALGEPAKNPRKEPRKAPPRERLSSAVTGDRRGHGTDDPKAAEAVLGVHLKQHQSNAALMLLPLRYLEAIGNEKWTRRALLQVLWLLALTLKFRACEISCPSRI